MKRLLVALLLLPCFTQAQTRNQESNPVVSKDYLDLIHNDSLHTRIKGPSHSVVTQIPAKRGYYFNEYKTVRKLSVKGNKASAVAYSSRTIMLGGTFSSTAGIKLANNMPALQSAYAQGRTVGGALQWRGPATNELFSYGPPLNTLEYDNSIYPYDDYGRLVPAGTGSGPQAHAYNNSLLRTGSFFEQALTFRARFMENGVNKIWTNVRIKKAVENLVLSHNQNKADEFSVNLHAYVKRISLSGRYLAVNDDFSNSNRIGFLNRAYQQSLLTPATFDNGQGYILAGGQRSYSAQGDNPLFLLKDNNNQFTRRNQVGQITVEKKTGDLRWRISQSAESLRQYQPDIYKPGTAYFLAGKTANRQQQDHDYLFNAELGYTDRFGEVEMSGNVIYFHNDNNTTIHYTPGNAYAYQRSANDLNISYRLQHHVDWMEYSVQLNNKMYFSNTSLDNAFFLPGITASINFNDVLPYDNLRIRLSGSFNRFNSELPIDRSLGHLALLQYPTSSFLQYFPTAEAGNFDGLKSTGHREWGSQLEVNFERLQFRGEVFSRYTFDDVFPTWNNGLLQLQKMADHHNQGYELKVTYQGRRWNRKSVQFDHSVSFFRYNNKVVKLHDARASVPLAGFSDVYKVLAEGQVLGAIAGSAYKRDASNNILVGYDGYPLVKSSPVVIGNPIPDFVMKFNHNIYWRGFTLALNIEWRKGGDVWNGTQAVLDYYGRSAATADLRNTQGYIFPGILPNGHVNDIPVKFYDPSQPLENNRWVRYGYAGVAEAYIQKGDYLRIGNLGLIYKFPYKKKMPQISLGLQGSNLIIWSAYKQGDATQGLLDQPQTEGLDFFNLPGARCFAFNVSLQF